MQLFSDHPKAAVLNASVWHRHEPAKARTGSLVSNATFIGCGHAIRLTAYRQVRGYLPRAIPYEMEESDLSLQLLAAGWDIYEVGDLRVFHDTDFKRHASPKITSGTITNLGLRIYLHYPIIAWGWGLLQLGNKIVYCIRMGRIRGIFSGIYRIPIDCFRNRRYRKPLPWQTLKSVLRFHRTGDI
jgi:hypothetical protein